VFCKIGASASIIQQQAARRQYKMRHLIETNPAFEDYPPYIAYDQTLASEFAPFRAIDTIRVLDSLIQEFININALTQHEIIKDYFPLHEQDKLDSMKKDMLGLLPTLQMNLKLKEIRDYFGEKVAVYFAWMQFYTNALILPSLLGVVLWFTSRNFAGSMF
jgi:hypothetical protein